MTPREMFNEMVRLARAYRAEATPINEPAADKPSGQIERTDNPNEQ